MKVWCTGMLLAAMTAAGAQAQRAQTPAPTHRNVSYGPHERNVLAFWKAESAGPAPLAVYIHGGGFRGGKKESVNARTLTELLDAGVSVAAVEYRLLAQAKLPAAHHDARRALQFLRSQAGEWNIDKTRVATFGGSAGAQICMWLAFHDEMADPDSPDPIERESTRLTAVATSGGQATMDFNWWKRWIPGYDKPHRPRETYFGSLSDAAVEPIIRDIGALYLISQDDPPIYMRYSMAPGDPPPGDPKKASGWRVHHVTFGVKLKEKLDDAGVESYLAYPGASPRYRSIAEFLKAKLTAR